MIKVPGVGPLESPLWMIGEAPGKTEVLRREPFVGMTGQFLQGCVQRAGMEWDAVRKDNTVPYLVKFPTDAPGKGKVIRKYWDHLASTLDDHKPKVVVAVGAVALHRITAAAPDTFTKPLTQILPANGGVIPIWGGRTLLIPILHPAGVFRGKIQSERVWLQKVITRAVKYAWGELQYAPKRANIVYPTAGEVNDVLKGVTRMVIDTEFDPRKEDTWMAGFTVDGETVFSVIQESLTGLMRAVLRKHMMREDLVKVAHFHQADVEALWWWGVDSREPWFDTLAAFSTLYPDLPCGLSHVSRFYLDDVWDWKGMNHKDPEYNAIDVLNTWRIDQEMCIELSDLGMWGVIEEEVMPTLPLLFGMKERGMQVDKRELTNLRARMKTEQKRLSADISTQVAEIYDNRRADVQKEVDSLERELKREQLAFIPEGCEVHPKYAGERKKKWAKNANCECQGIFLSPGSCRGREAVAALRQEINKLKGKIKRWSNVGFDPDNNDHLRWLLYDKRGLGLPVQRNKDTRQPTANATAIARLLALKGVQGRAGVATLLRDIKRHQHLTKMRDTFGKPPLDRRWRVYPPYRMHGTGTGRPAGGDDAYLHEKGVGSYKFNALNIPDEMRKVYIPFRRDGVDRSRSARRCRDRNNHVAAMRNTSESAGGS